MPQLMRDLHARAPVAGLLGFAHPVARSTARRWRNPASKRLIAPLRIGVPESVRIAHPGLEQRVFVILDSLAVVAAVTNQTACQ